MFVRNPLDILGTLTKSPIHAPLEANLSALADDRAWTGVSTHRLREFMREQGIVNQAYLCSSVFWIVHHDAIDTVYDLALGFWHKTKEAGIIVDVSAALGYEMQILCADPETHWSENHPDVWASDDAGQFCEVIPDGSPWSRCHPLRSEVIEIRPAIIHLPNSKKLLAALRDGSC